MSTHFRLLKKVSACQLFNRRLEKLGVREEVVPDETTEVRRCLYAKGLVRAEYERLAKAP